VPFILAFQSIALTEISLFLKKFPPAFTDTGAFLLFLIYTTAQKHEKDTKDNQIVYRT
jgi:hypothetical protein